MRIAPPCHPEARLEVELATAGRAYLTYEVPDGFYCSAIGCFNTWDVDGNPS